MSNFGEVPFLIFFGLGKIFGVFVAQISQLKKTGLHGLGTNGCCLTPSGVMESFRKGGEDRAGSDYPEVDCGFTSLPLFLYMCFPKNGG